MSGRIGGKVKLYLHDCGDYNIGPRGLYFVTETRNPFPLEATYASKESAISAEIRRRKHGGRLHEGGEMIDLGPIKARIDAFRVERKPDETFELRQLVDDDYFKRDEKGHKVFYDAFFIRNLETLSSYAMEKATAEFVLGAITDVPALVAEVERLREQLLHCLKGTL
jgi:hypothetical protein